MLFRSSRAMTVPYVEVLYASGVDYCQARLLGLGFGVRVGAAPTAVAKFNHQPELAQGMRNEVGAVLTLDAMEWGAGMEAHRAQSAE